MGGPQAGHKALHTCTSWYAYAAMFGSSIRLCLCSRDHSIPYILAFDLSTHEVFVCYRQKGAHQSCRLVGGGGGGCCGQEQHERRQGAQCHYPLRGPYSPMQQSVSARQPRGGQGTINGGLRPDDKRRHETVARHNGTGRRWSRRGAPTCCFSTQRIFDRRMSPSASPAAA